MKNARHLIGNEKVQRTLAPVYCEYINYSCDYYTLENECAQREQVHIRNSRLQFSTIYISYVRFAR